MFLLLGGIAPLVYGIFNAGTLALCVLGAYFTTLPKLYKLLGVLPRLRAAMLACTAVFLIYSTTVSAMIAARANNPPPDRGEVAVIVLGAKVNGSEPSLMLRRRLDKAVIYMNQNPDAICVVAGGQGPNEDYPEAQVMGDYMERHGIARDRIIREDKSTSTAENFKFSAVLLEERGLSGRPVVTVTDTFHQLRAYIYAKAAIPEAEGYCAVNSLTPWGLVPAYWVRELMGIGLAVMVA